SLLGLAPALLLVLAVLGVMFAGIAGPTEAAAVGALGSLVIALSRGKLDWHTTVLACRETLKSTTMVMWIALSSLLFVSVYAGVGGDQLVRGLLTGLDVAPWVVLAAMMVIVFALGT